jgi:acyl carrier protein
LYDKLKSVLVNDLELKEEDVRLEATLEEAGLDSLGMVELAMVLRKEYGAELSDDELVDTATVADIADLLAQRSRSELNSTNG